ncbi:MAG: hypothetical protein ACRC0B_02725 [Legionella sp.]
MSDFSSKLPDLKELTSMTTKLFNGLKKTVNEIVHDYKEKRAEDEVKEQRAEVVTDAATKAAAEQVTPVEPSSAQTKPDAPKSN